MIYSASLLAEGTSDRSLLPILNWIMKRLEFESIPDIQFATTSEFSGQSLAAKAKECALEHECDVLFVHRDADAAGYEKRLEEINDIVIGGRVVPVIPVRETEAWLLIDETAIRRGVGNPSGRMPLDLPKLSEIERLAGAKERLRQAMSTASGLSGRRLSKFSARASITYIANEIGDFSPLLAFESFQKLQANISSLKDVEAGQ